MKGEDTMSKKRLQDKVQELVELREMAAELADEIAAIEDEIKAHMDKAGTDTLEAGKHVIRWAVVSSSRFDSKAFRETFPAFTTTIPSQRNAAGSPSNEKGPIRQHPAKERHMKPHRTAGAGPGSVYHGPLLFCNPRPLARSRICTPIVPQRL